MPDILHRVGVKRDARSVYKAIATIEGLRHWWTTETSGNPAQGKLIDFGFCRMRVVASKPGKRVHWRCEEGPREWVGTEVEFDLKPAKGQTYVLFKHSGWKKPVEFMHHCSTKWAVFLLSLKGWLENEEGRPAPYDVKLHAGD